VPQRNREGADEHFPSPPFPDRDHEVFQLILRAGLAHFRKTRNAEQALVYVGVHAWSEGHIQGEDACPGCDYRGALPRQHRKRLVRERSPQSAAHRTHLDRLTEAVRILGAELARAEADPAYQARLTQVLDADLTIDEMVGLLAAFKAAPGSDRPAPGMDS
jgi:hypothetical protein